jgi:cytochrome c-type biogenesis protein
LETGFLLSFLAGIVSIFSPCVLPLIPIILGHSFLRSGLREIISFIGGFFLLFAIITVLTVLFTVAINYYLFYFRIAAALLLIIVGLFFILNPKITNLSIASRKEAGITGSFVLGFLTCLAWSPCFGPYVVAVAAYSASTGNIFYSAVNMILFAAGFSVTLLAIALLASRINTAAIMKYYKWIRIVSGLIIAIAGFYLLTGLIG